MGLNVLLNQQIAWHQNQKPEQQSQTLRGAFILENTRDHVHVCLSFLDRNYKKIMRVRLYEALGERYITSLP